MKLQNAFTFALMAFSAPFFWYTSHKEKFFLNIDVYSTFLMALKDVTVKKTLL